ncbi:MAG: CHAT domain-containing protein [Magnetococcus sp. YQC-5]
MNKHLLFVSRMMVSIGMLLVLVGSAWSASVAPSQVAPVGGRIASLLATGHFIRVLDEGKPAVEAARKGEKPQEVVQLLVPMGMAAQALGLFTDAEAYLHQARDLVDQTGNVDDKAYVLMAQGDLLLASDQPGEAVKVLQEGVALARKHANSPFLAALLNNLGNALLVQRSFPLAEEVFEEAVTLARKQGDGLQESKILINSVHLALRQGDLAKTATRLDAAIKQVSAQPESRWQGFALVTLGHMALRLTQQNVAHQPPMALVVLEVLQKAAKVARHLEDWKTLSYALGYQGELYEYENRWKDAEKLTSEAIFHAKNTGSSEILYLWEWQQGRLAKARNQLAAAQEWYRNAVKTLGLVRHDFHLGLRDTPDSFRDLIGPVYYQLADLLLRQSAKESDTKRKEAILVEARNVIETLKTAEMQNLFHDDCVAALNSKQTALDQVLKNTAVYYPIPLSDRLELLLTLPAGMKQIVVPVKSGELEEEVRQLRSQLEAGQGTGYLPHAQRLYRWLMEPILAELRSGGIDTIVVVPDGALRTIPFAALHDGKEFLVEHFALAVTPSLRLTEPKSLMQGGSISLLVNAMSKAAGGFPALPNVPGEVEHVRKLFPGRVLMDEAFTVQDAVGALATEPYSIVHIASHGQFDRDPKKTFLLASDGKLSLDRLQDMIGQSKFRDQPVELLTLSACQTAVGDDRAALGLAGVALKAGARSALASLWFVDDEATAGLVTAFYQNIRDTGQSKAIALKNAQKKLIHNKSTEHPGLWAAFIMIGNWL